MRFLHKVCFCKHECFINIRYFLQFFRPKVHISILMCIFSNVSDAVLSSLVFRFLFSEMVNLTLFAPQDIKAASLRTLTSIVHLERTPKLSNIIDCTGTASYHGFLPVLVRNCIQAMIGEDVARRFCAAFQNISEKIESLFVHLSFPRSSDGALSTPVRHCTLLIPLPFG